MMLPRNRDDPAAARRRYRKTGMTWRSRENVTASRGGVIRRPQKMIQHPFTHNSPGLRFLLFIILLKSSVIRCIIVKEIY